MTASLFRQFDFPKSIKKYVASVLLAMSMIAAAPHSAMASGDDVEHYDARVQGYTPDVELKSSSTGGCWVMMICLGIVCVSVIFKDARRSHLD